MTQAEQNILDRYVKGINIRLIWALVVMTAISCSTVLSIYYSIKNDIAMQRLEMKFLEARLDRLEKEK